MASLRDLIDQNLAINMNSSTNVFKLIWNLVFTFSEVEIYELASIINQVESLMLKTIEKIFQLTSPEALEKGIQWSQWALSIDPHIDAINFCFLHSNELNYEMDPSKIESLIRQIKNAIDFLKNATEIDNMYWNTKEILDCCENECQRLISLMLKQNEIKNKKIELFDYLNDLEVDARFRNEKGHY